MIQLRLEVQLLSDALIASGEGFGAIIDSDILFDDVGLPYIPARRLKGCLHDCANKAEAYLMDCDLSWPISAALTFGHSGQSKPAPVYFSDLKIQEYEANYAWLKYLLNEKEIAQILSKNSVMESMTSIRHQIKINEQGVTQAHSLRTMRVAQKGLIFEGEIQIHAEGDELQHIKNTLVLACRELDEMGLGAKRTRGLGVVECKLFQREQLLNKQLMEALCTA